MALAIEFSVLQLSIKTVTGLFHLKVSIFMAKCKLSPPDARLSFLVFDLDALSMLFAICQLSEVECFPIVPDHPLVESITLRYPFSIIHAILVFLDNRFRDLLGSKSLVDGFEEGEDGFWGGVGVQKGQRINMRGKHFNINGIDLNILNFPKLNFLLGLGHR
jgi:hypothetical protein